MSFMTLPANQARSDADRASLAGLLGKSLTERAASRAKVLKEIASGDGDITRVSLSEGRFIDLAIHKDTFLDDVALRTDVTASTPLAWKSRYTPPVGVTVGSVYGGGSSSLYATLDNDAFINPFVVDVPGVKTPTMALSQDPSKLGVRDAAYARQAEALRLKMEGFLAAALMDQPQGTDLATCVTNYWSAGASYAGKTVYVADPGVQSGTYETSNLIDASAEAGMTPATFESLMVQEMKTGRRVQTIHCPVQGFPFRKLLRVATVVANASVFTAGNAPNTSLESVPANVWEKMYNMDISTALQQGLIIELFGRRYKIKANNALPQGYCIVTTDQPAAEVFNVTDRSVSVDVDDPREPYFTEHYEKRMMAIAVPHPWVRNFWLLNVGNTSF